MASARQAALLERRKGELKRRILSPANTSVSSIAKKTATNELNAMISKYNSGLVGNDEMKVFLQKMLTTPGISDADKLDVQEQVRDFDSRIMKDKLEADFKGAQENSLTQAQAAIALSNYHKQRAAAMVAGTPAYSTAMESAATWDNKVQDINRNVAKTARTNQRLTKEQQIAQYPHNSSDRATAKAQAFLELYNQAATDGDATEANRYYRDYQEQLTYAQELGTRETEQADKEAKSGRRRVIIDTINQLANAYHDGQITANQFAQAIPEIEAAAVEIGDTSIQLQLNRWADSLAKDVAKGVRRGEIQGLPTVVGKGGTGAGGTQTDWDVQDHDYSDNIRLAQSALKTGKFSSEIYLQAIGTAIQERANQLQNRLETIDAIASENPNAKITYNGRKQRAEDVLKNLEELAKDPKN